MVLMMCLLCWQSSNQSLNKRSVLNIAKWWTGHEFKSNESIFWGRTVFESDLFNHFICTRADSLNQYDHNESIQNKQTNKTKCTLFPQQMCNKNHSDIDRFAKYQSCISVEVNSFCNSIEFHRRKVETST